jgi:tRNA pseudouridine32 synthase/23S rRNA pseudouridine746 synthase
MAAVNEAIQHLPLPTLAGVGPSCVALPEGNWPTIIAFLLHRFPGTTLQDWLKRMAAHQVVDQHGQAVMPDRGYQAQLKVYYYRSLYDEPAVPFAHTILFEDGHLLAVDKPHFLPVTPSGRFLHQTLLVRLKKELGCDTLTPLHRLDRETAGVVLFSKQPQERGAYQALLRERLVSKQYEAIAPWRPDLEFPLTRRSRIIEDERQFFRQREVAGVANSETTIDVLETTGGMARYSLTPVTGKTHQLRVHMAALGLPIANDLYYPLVRQTRDELGSEDMRQPLQLLARAIAFTDPVTGQQRRFESRRALLPLGAWASPSQAAHA